MASESLTIGQVAARAGLRTSSIRYYESVGVLADPQRVGGQRRYSPEIFVRLGFIDVAQRAGFSLEEIRQLLEGSSKAQASERLQELARRKLPEVEGLIARAEAMKGWLEAAQSCECPTLEMCLLFEDAAQASLPDHSAGAPRHRTAR
jgi:MerR family transcriptional regulator, redox-sensitive transcriptional activator SoxR